MTTLPLRGDKRGGLTDKRATFSTRKKKLRRTVTRFIDQSNLEDTEQIDLAEFILAAQYLTDETDTSKLMNVFSDLETTGQLKKQENETTKDTVKRLMSNVGYDQDNALEEEVNEYYIDDEVLMPKPLNSMNEDSAWQDNKLDGFLANTYDEQNVSIARNLLVTTALSSEQISEITGVSVEKIEQIIDEEEDVDGDSDYSTDEDFEDDNDDKNNQDNDDNKEKEKPSVTVKNEKTNKEVSLSLKEIEKLDSLITDGVEAIKLNGDDVVNLLRKLRKCIGLSPQGMKKMKTVRHLQVFGKEFDKPKTEDKQDTKKDDTKKTNENKLSKEENNRKQRIDKAVKIIQKSKKKKIPKNDVIEFLKNRDMTPDDIDEAFRIAFFDDNTFPCRYRVVIHPGALVKEKADLKSKQVGKIPIGTLVIVEEIQGRRARMSKPKKGWCSVTSGDKRSILQKEGTKSPEMVKALQADRANETKIQILQSVTTLNDSVVRRILEKSDWNLRRAIDAFYIAKFQTQKYMKNKEENQNNKNKKEDTKNTKQNKKQTNNSLGPNKTSNNSNNNTNNNNKNKKGFWKSWSKFVKN